MQAAAGTDPPVVRGAVVELRDDRRAAVFGLGLRQTELLRDQREGGPVIIGHVDLDKTARTVQGGTGGRARPLRMAYRAGLGPGGPGAVPGQGHDHVALLSSPVDHHLVVGIIQVGLQDKPGKKGFSAH